MIGICNVLICLKTRNLMTTITERFVFGMTAAAQRSLFSPPGNTAAAGNNREITREQQRTIGYWPDCQFASIRFYAIALFAHGSIIHKPGLDMAVVTERFIF